MLEYQEDELLGKSIEEIVVEEKQGLFRAGRFDQLIQQGVVHNLEMNYLSKEGRKIPVMFSGSVMCDEAGHIQGVVCVARDITERKQLEIQDARKLCSTVF